MWKTRITPIRISNGRGLYNSSISFNTILKAPAGAIREENIIDTTEENYLYLKRYDMAYICIYNMYTYIYT